MEQVTYINWQRLDKVPILKIKVSTLNWYYNQTTCYSENSSCLFCMFYQKFHPGPKNQFQLINIFQ